MPTGTEAFDKPDWRSDELAPTEPLRERIQSRTFEREVTETVGSVVNNDGVTAAWHSRTAAEVSRNF